MAVDPITDYLSVNRLYNLGYHPTIWSAYHYQRLLFDGGLFFVHSGFHHHFYAPDHAADQAGRYRPHLLWRHHVL